MPYSRLPPHAFWKLCRNDPNFRADALFAPKFRLRPGDRVATAGSCFAQNIGRYIRPSALHLVDVEPPPDKMPDRVAERFGYGLYSARYGNIYTARQLRQLLEDAIAGRVHDAAIWQRDGRWFDAMRPNCEPDGFADIAELRAHRLDHLARVRSIFEQADVFVFTLGLTETWAHRTSGIVFPTAPGVIAGKFDPELYEFCNLGMADTLEDLDHAIRLMHELAPGLNILLTVSPVPLTATASGQHVLTATSYSKSVLRAVAGEVAALDPRIDYFPSYEMVTGTPFAADSYGANLRSVTPERVADVMGVFFAAQDGLIEAEPHDPAPTQADQGADPDDLVCEEAMLEMFAPK